MKTNVQVTSVISYYVVLNELSRRQKEVLLCLKHLGIANNLMIARCLNLPINSITGRMNELRHKGIVIYHHTGACPVMKSTTRFFTIKSYIMESMG